MADQLGTVTHTAAVPVAGCWDVVVAGGGPAGIGAAIAAARAGARTLLIEPQAVLGGMMSAGRVSGWCDTPGGKIGNELEAALAALGEARRRYDPERHLHAGGRCGFHGETMGLLALRLLTEAGGEVWFGTTAEGPWLAAGRVAGVFVANQAGRSLVQATVVIDATGDGNVAAGAGAEVLHGDPDDGRLQDVAFNFGLDRAGDAAAAVATFGEEELLARLAAARGSGLLRVPAGVSLPPPATFPYEPVSRQLRLSQWEVRGVDSADPVAASRCLTDCQLAAQSVVEFAREHLPGFERCRVGRLPQMLQARESRRIVGHYLLTGEDARTARKFPDGIARACFYADLHDPPPGPVFPHTMEYKRATTPPPGDWYEIPYRCLVPRGVTGLLVAGRCISSDRPAQGSLRIQTTCLWLGEAAGVAAAMAVRDGVPPDQVPGERVREVVMDGWVERFPTE